jgi:hypothetical protein
MDGEGPIAPESCQGSEAMHHHGNGMCPSHFQEVAGPMIRPGQLTTGAVR